MRDTPKTLEEARKIRYSGWAGNPKGNSYTENKCAYNVWPSDGTWIPYQCRRKNGHGSEGLYCKQHAKMIGE